MKVAVLNVLISAFLLAAPLLFSWFPVKKGSFWGLFDTDTAAPVERSRTAVSQEQDAQQLVSTQGSAASSPLITVLTMTRDPNVEWLKETRDSIQAQTLSRWQWVVVDDGSREAAVRDSIDDLVSGDARMWSVHTTAQGRCKAKQAGLDLVDTPYVMYLDDDDKLDATTLEKGVWFLEMNQQFPAASFHTQAFGGEQYHHEHGFVDGNANLLMNLNTAPSVLRTDAMRSHLPVARADADCSLEDWRMWLNLASHGKWGFTIPESLVLKRERSEQERLAQNLQSKRHEFLPHSTAKMEFEYPELFWNGVPEVLPRATAADETLNLTLPFGRPEIHSSDNGQRVMLVLPSASSAVPATQMALKLLRKLSKDGWKSTVVFAEATPEGSTSAQPEFSELTQDVFELPNFLRLADAPRFIGSLVAERAPRAVLLSHSPVGYMSLPIVRQHLPAKSVVVDYVHELEDSVVAHSHCLDHSMAASKEVAAALAQHGLFKRASDSVSAIESEEFADLVLRKLAQTDRVAPSCAVQENAMSDVWRRVHEAGDVGSKHLMERRKATSRAADMWGAPASKFKTWQPPAEQKAMVFLFETESSRPQEEVPLLWYGERYASQLWAHDVPHRIVGSKQPYHGWGTKWHAVKPALEELSPDTVVVISDMRDVLLNQAQDAGAVADQLVSAFEALVHTAPKGAIVASTESRCCVSALTNVKPGDYFAPDGSRTTRACASGQADCPWQREGRQPWDNFMQRMAKKRGAGGPEVFPNAGLVAGRAKDLLNLVRTMDIQETEDDQAVISDLLFHKPEMVVLDYNQTLFGNSRWWRGMEDGGCPYSVDQTSQKLTHNDYGTRPLFVHVAAGFLECFNSLATSMGLEAPAVTELSGAVDDSSWTSRSLVHWTHAQIVANPSRQYCNYHYGHGSLRNQQYCGFADGHAFTTATTTYTYSRVFGPDLMVDATIKFHIEINGDPQVYIADPRTAAAWRTVIAEDAGIKESEVTVTLAVHTPVYRRLEEVRLAGMRRLATSSIDVFVRMLFPIDESPVTRANQNVCTAATDNVLDNALLVFQHEADWSRAGAVNALLKATGLTSVSTQGIESFVFTRVDCIHPLRACPMEDLELEGQGCCRFDNMDPKDRGPTNIADCIDTCNDDANCVAADLNDDISADPDEFRCTHFHMTPSSTANFLHDFDQAENFRTECDTQDPGEMCFKKPCITTTTTTCITDMEFMGTGCCRFHQNVSMTWPIIPRTSIAGCLQMCLDDPLCVAADTWDEDDGATMNVATSHQVGQYEYDIICTKFYQGAPSMDNFHTACDGDRLCYRRECVADPVNITNNTTPYNNTSTYGASDGDMSTVTTTTTIFGAPTPATTVAPTPATTVAPTPATTVAGAPTPATTVVTTVVTTPDPSGPTPAPPTPAPPTPAPATPAPPTPAPPTPAPPTPAPPTPAPPTPAPATPAPATPAPPTPAPATPAPPTPTPPTPAPATPVPTEAQQTTTTWTSNTVTVDGGPITVNGKGQLKARLTAGDKATFLADPAVQNAIEATIAETLGGGITADMVTVSLQDVAGGDEVIVAFDVSVPLGTTISATPEGIKDTLDTTDMATLMSSLQGKLSAPYQVAAATGAGDDRAVLTGITIEVPQAAGGTAGTGDEEAFAHSQVSFAAAQLLAVAVFFFC